MWPKAAEGEGSPHPHPQPACWWRTCFLSFWGPSPPVIFAGDGYIGRVCREQQATSPPSHELREGKLIRMIGNTVPVSVSSLSEPDARVFPAQPIFWGGVFITIMVCDHSSLLPWGCTFNTAVGPCWPSRQQGRGGKVRESLSQPWLAYQLLTFLREDPNPNAQVGIWGNFDFNEATPLRTGHPWPPDGALQPSPLYIFSCINRNCVFI